VISSAASIVLADNEKMHEPVNRGKVSHTPSAEPGNAQPGCRVREPFLRIPPFPGAKLSSFTPSPGEIADPSDLCAELRRVRVGGSYWAAQPELPSGCVLVRSATALERAVEMSCDRPVVLWTNDGVVRAGVENISGDCDPWHVIERAALIITDEHDELRLIAALLGVPCHLQDDGQLTLDHPDIAALLDQVLSGTYENPFTGEPMAVREAIELCGFWRRLIDSNRDIAGGMGFAFWKQHHVAPLLWNGSSSFRFVARPAELRSNAPVAVWRTRAPPQALAALERSNTPLIEVEDGFLRSRGLGADCIPPLSITVDRLGAHFDPSGPSELELMIERGEFSDDVLARARDLRCLIVEAGLGKYDQGAEIMERPAGQRRHILVPGQVEDDRAVQAGGCGLTSNLELLKQVRSDAPDAYVLYKPHPDVVAGHRRGAIPERICLQYADQVVGDLPIGSLIGMVDEVHVNTSLAGFEALLRGKQVTAYGVPFYAGWGLTRDLGPVPTRRTARRTIDELVAATLLQYPRYFDPVTGLPCPAEVVVARLSQCEERDPGLLVGMRRLQGRLMRRLRSLVQ
jgi:capsular polysaccharide export protein